jgi:hypothetical protein
MSCVDQASGGRSIRSAKDRARFKELGFEELAGGLFFLVTAHSLRVRSLEFVRGAIDTEFLQRRGLEPCLEQKQAEFESIGLSQAAFFEIGGDVFRLASDINSTACELMA